MKEYPMHLPITFSYKRNKFEEKLIALSNKTFENFKRGLVFAILNNALFLYLCYHKRPFFYPGSMSPKLARCMVNLSRACEGDLVLDPFCGTGGILLEGLMLNMRTVGTDMDIAMLKGCLSNLPQTEVLKVDSTKLPITDCSVDTIATDLPYGQSVCIKAESMNALYNDSLSEMRRVLKKGRRAVVVTHIDIREIAKRHFTIVQYHEQRVHKSLTRRIMVLE